MSDRVRLPDRRRAETFELRHSLPGMSPQPYTVTIGYYHPFATARGVVRWQPGEVFVSSGKAGSSLDAFARDASVLLSIAMQHGVPLEVLKHAMTREADGAASTVIGAVIDELHARDQAAA